MSDKDFLKWIYDRLIYIHREDQGYDYMRRLEKLIESIPNDSDKK
jgi:hypothetical protein